jgi:ssDNA-binding Zn-finger/Zn-ribbon topoisomerase 1
MSEKPENVKCPDCDGPMVSRSSAHGRFWGCANYPRCRGTRNSLGDARTRFESDTDARTEELPSDRWRNRDRRRWDSSEDSR